MKRKAVKWRKLLGTTLCAALLTTSLGLPTQATESTDNYVAPVKKVADASTQDVWSDLMNSYQSTEFVGRIWTDKTVSADGVTLEYKFNSEGSTTTTESTKLKMDEKSDFQVVMSAMSSAQSVYGQAEAYMDVMIILDISSSMYNGSSYDMKNLRSLVDSVNATIEKVQGLNDYNRVGVVLYYGGSGYYPDAQSTVDESGLVLLELGRYTNSNWNSEDTIDKYVSLNENARSVSSSTYLEKDGKDYAVKSHSLPTIAGTYMQLGILNAMNQFLGVDTTTTAKGDAVEHTPVFILMSDGEPTASTNNFSKIEDAKFGNNTVHSRNSNESDFVTQLTAAYAKAQVDSHYKTTTPLFYTLSLGYSVSVAVMDPSRTIDEEERSKYESDAPPVDEEKVKEYWNTLIKNGSVSYTTNPHRDLTQTYGPRTYETKTVLLDENDKSSTFPASIKQMEYVDEVYTAKNADALPDAFDEIFTKIVEKTASSPTFITSGNDAAFDGYVTLVDELGDYMEIKSVDAVTIEGEVYNYKEIGSSTTSSDESGAYTENNYTFTKEVSLNTVLKARVTDKQVEENLNEIIIVERDYEDASARDTLTVKIPASLLPLRYYQVDEEGNLTIKETLPVRVVYSVGLLDSVRAALTTGNYDSVSGLTDYVTSHTNEEGNIEFLSNYWDGGDHNNDGYFDGNSYSSFSPAQNNSFYYYPEDTTFYKLSEDGTYTPVKSTGNYEKDLGGETTVYYPHTYYRLSKDETTGEVTTEEVTTYVGLSVEKAIPVIGITWNEISAYVGVDKDGNYYMKAGNSKLSLANDTRFIETKKDSPTNTATTVINPTWNSNSIGGQYDTYKTQNYMGNNGKVAYEGMGNLAISKYVEAADGLTPSADAEFEFTITLSGEFKAGETYEYRVTHSGNEEKETISFTADGDGTATTTETLKNLETLTIYGISHNVIWKVEEKEQAPYKVKYYCEDVTGTTNEKNDGIGTIVAGETDTIDVSNTYTVTSASTNFNLSGTKILNIKEDTTFTQTNTTFDFYLQQWSGNYEDDPENDGQWLYVKNDGTTTAEKTDGVTATATYSAGGSKIVYDNINTALSKCKFDSVGQYFFRVLEKNSGQTIDGIYYDGLIHSFIVTVKDDGQGSLYVESVVCSHTDESADNHWKSLTDDSNVTTWQNSEVDFTNEYGTTKLSISIDKTVNDSTGGGYDINNGYVFDWKYLGSYKEMQTDLIGLDSKYEGGAISGSSDPTTADGIASFTIEYDADDNHPNPVVSTETGKHLYPSSSETDAGGNKKSTTYYEYYKIVEKVPDDSNKKDSITYSSQVYYVQVPVTVTGTDITADYSVVQYINNSDVTFTYDAETSSDGKHVWKPSEGQSIIRPDDDDLIFTNTYSDEIDVTLGVTKRLEGREWKGGDSFSFTLTPTQFTRSDGTVLGTKFYLEENDNETYTAVAGETEGVKPIATAANESITSFGDIAFTRVGTYCFTVTENDGTLGGITYDDTTHSVRVVVTANQNYELTAEVSTYTGGTITANNNEIFEVANFKNTYKAAPVKVVLGGTKTLSGRDLAAGEFTFVLYDEEGTVVTGARNDSNGKYSFSALTFDKTGTYAYTVKENNDGKGGVIYDTKEYAITINVTDDGSGQLKAAASVGGDSVEMSSDSDETGLIYTYAGLNYENKYEASGELIIPVMKTIEGRSWKFGDSFTFELYDKNPRDTAEGSTAIATITLEIEAPKGIGEGVENIVGYFDKISYKAAGNYTYYIVESSIDGNGIKVDNKMYQVNVEVTDDKQGKLIPSVTYSVVGGESASEVVFTNTYSAENAVVELAVNKALTGRSWNDRDSFAFELAAVTNDAPMPRADKITIENTAGSTDDVKEAFSKIEFDTPGTYEYTIKETNGGSTVDGLSYDETIYNVKVVVEDNYEGELVADITYNGEKAEAALFTNIYSATGSLVLDGKKNLTGRDIKDGEFKFTLMDADKNKLQTVKNVGDTFTFEAISYTEKDVTAEGEYITYYVSEDKTGLGGIFYDETVYRVDVKVADQEDGTLVATVESCKVVESGTESADGLTFNNVYTVGGEAEVQFGGTKKMEGDTYNGGDLSGFQFALYEEGGTKPLETATSNTAGNYVFNTIKYTKIGTYKYTVKEINTGVTNVTYDDTVYNITIEVEDKDSKVKITDVKITTGENILTQFVSGALVNVTFDKLDFTNKFEADEPDKPVSPDTGDYSNIVLWAVVMVLSVVCAVAVILKRRKK